MSNVSTMTYELRYTVHITDCTDYTQWTTSWLSKEDADLDAESYENLGDSVERGFGVYGRDVHGYIHWLADVIDEATGNLLIYALEFTPPPLPNIEYLRMIPDNDNIRSAA